MGCSRCVLEVESVRLAFGLVMGVEVCAQRTVALGPNSVQRWFFYTAQELKHGFHILKDENEEEKEYMAETICG